jgi:hypothetical protein
MYSYESSSNNNNNNNNNNWGQGKYLLKICVALGPENFKM